MRRSVVLFAATSFAMSQFAAAFDVRAKPDSSSHLLRGAELFRDGDFDGAAVEFRVAERLGAPNTEATWYLAAALTQMQRHEEAAAVFARASRRAPQHRDALLDYYFAVAAFRANLLLLADGLLRGVEANAGPKMRDQAKRLLSDISARLVLPLPPDRVADMLARGDDALRSSSPDLARLCFLEAAALAVLVGDHPAKDAAASGVAAAEKILAFEENSGSEENSRSEESPKSANGDVQKGVR